MKTNTESGFSIIESLLVVVALGLIGFAGHYVYQTNKAVDSLNANPKASQTTTLTTDTKSTIPSATTATVAPAATATDTPAIAPDVKSSSDLTTASTTVDETDPTTSNSSDIAELDAELESL